MDRKLYQQKMQAQLDEWRADLDKMRAKASGMNADAKIKMHHQIENMETKIKEGKQKLAELAGASDDAWDSIKEGAESIWGIIKKTFNDAKSKFEEH